MIASTPWTRLLPLGTAALLGLSACTTMPIRHPANSAECCSRIAETEAPPFIAATPKTASEAAETTTVRPPTDQVPDLDVAPAAPPPPPFRGIVDTPSSVPGSDTVASPDRQLEPSPAGSDTAPAEPMPVAPETNLDPKADLPSPSRVQPPAVTQPSINEQNSPASTSSAAGGQQGATAGPNRSAGPLERLRMRFQAFVHPSPAPTPKPTVVAASPVLPKTIEPIRSADSLQSLTTMRIALPLSPAQQVVPDNIAPRQSFFTDDRPTTSPAVPNHVPEVTEERPAQAIPAEPRDTRPQVPAKGTPTGTELEQWPYSQAQQPSLPNAGDSVADFNPVPIEDYRAASAKVGIESAAQTPPSWDVRNGGNVPVQATHLPTVQETAPEQVPGQAQTNASTGEPQRVLPLTSGGASFDAAVGLEEGESQIIRPQSFSIPAAQSKEVTSNPAPGTPRSEFPIGGSFRPYAKSDSVRPTRLAPPVGRYSQPAWMTGAARPRNSAAAKTPTNPKSTAGAIKPMVPAPSTSAAAFDSAVGRGSGEHVRTAGG